MADWRVTEPGFIGAQGITETSTTQKHEIGKIVKARDYDTSDYGEGEFIYAKGVASTAIGSWVILGDSGTTALASEDDVGPVGVAMSANVASQFGWYQVGGTAAGKVLASFAATTELGYLTSTAGSLDDAVVAGDNVIGLKALTAIDTPSSGLAEFNLSRPAAMNV